MDRNAEAEEVLNGLGDKSDDALLLLARVQRALNKPEAVDAYSAYLKKKDDPAVRFEFAEALEDQKLYARAFGEYSAVSENLSAGGYPEKSLVVFRMARTLLVSEPSNKQGPALLEEAIKSGYRDAEELDALLEKTSLPAARKTELRALYQ
jgi:hypothetical protein